MKNIHVLPTDKPSRLLYNFTLKSFCIQTEKDGMFINDGNVAGADFWSIEKANNNGFRYINICITSNEEIKVNDYITDGYKVWQWKDDSSLLGRKKVILTTDQDLIKDGVQDIDDEFLEWFCSKNQSCEEVEVTKEDWMLNPDVDFFYKIIIPKEEPKQDVTSKNHALIFDDSTYERKKFNSLLLDVGHWSFPKEEPKEETLKEVAERFLSKELLDLSDWDKRHILKAMVNMSKWQQQQTKKLYSEKQMDDAYDKGFNDAIEKMYSEEEVIRIAKLSYNKARIATGNSEVSFNIWFDTWFEQFKKK